MELKLVYRCLRQLSVWVADDYYGDIVADGEENVPQSGPVILAATHRNESIDVAILAVTVPHGRQVSYWAKSSLFKQPVLRWIMQSSGAIPVQRGAESAASDANNHADGRAASQTQADLFRASTACLLAGGTLGVFPEGFSATLPGPGDLRSGAAWAAVEHDRAALARAGEAEKSPPWTSARIIPVSIVYTDAPAYRSSILVRYGSPIVTSDFYSATVNEGDLAAQKSAVGKVVDALRLDLETQGINAQDWETLNAAKAVVQMRDDELSLQVKQWLTISQLRRPHSGAAGNERLAAAKATLARYYALQLHTRISHADLQALLPRLGGGRIPLVPFLARSFVTFLHASIRTMLCLPPLLVYLPAYAASVAATAISTRPDEPESHAQVSAIAGGLGLGVGFLSAWSAVRRVCGSHFELLVGSGSTEMSRYASLVSRSRLGRLALGYVALKTLMTWHNIFAKGMLHSASLCIILK
ncbi:hypothetical protein HDZ31DRAFT_35277 [Schizophyllum fasciatum]